jgi:Undecaprenyl-phosphate glucose phosphotransferase
MTTHELVSAAGGERRRSVRADDAPRQGHWSASYASIGPIVCAVDVLLIILLSCATGTAYNHFILATDANIVRYAATGSIIASMFAVAFHQRGLYDPTALVNWTLQARNIVILLVLTFLVFAGAAFILKIGKEFSRGAVLSFATSGMVALLVHHAIWRVAVEAALKKGSLRGRKCILLTTNEGASNSLNIREATRNLANNGFQIERIVSLGTGEQARKLVEQEIALARGSDIEEIFFATDLRHWQETHSLVEHLGVLPLPLTLLPDECTAPLFRQPSRHFGATIGVEYRRSPLNVTERFWKRLLDLICAICGVVLLMPMFFIIAIAIKIDSPGPVLFIQTRHGFNSKRFKIFKFRTMSVMEDGVFVKQAMRDDARVTRLGKWLRKTSIDELPQLFNVLFGNMSIVGPRPHAASHDSYYDDLISHYAFRHHMKPGITGWAQINGCRGETPTVEAMKDRVDLDVWYIDNWSIQLDIQIICRTASELIRGRNAY